jgi:hypothetical protein
MIKKLRTTYSILYITILCAITSCSDKINDYSDSKKPASIFPDYNGVVIPPNIAPLNFVINEKGKRFHVEIFSKSGERIIIDQTSPVIDIPARKWHKLLDRNKGNNLYINIFIKNAGWTKYAEVIDSIVEEKLDNYLVYRVINSQYTYSSKMKLCQRNIENFDESLIYENTPSNEGCFNCHSFCNNNPQKMSLHFRHFFTGTMILDSNLFKKVSTKTKYTMSPFGYMASWHPNGNLIAYSVNIFNEYFLNSKSNFYEVTDQASDLVVYNIKTNTVTTSPKISTKSRENFPIWSPDGKYLYFISAPETKGDFNSRFYSKYSLLKIAYNPDSNAWGDVDTVISASKTGMSITFPKISPDGRYLMFCAIEYGYFSINHLNSELYLLDLHTKKCRPLDLNSSFNDSYHAWSKSGRWFVFSSKRLDNLTSRPFFSYFDKNGKEHKPFVLPQHDPLFYNSFIFNFNIPELVTGKVPLYPRKIRDLLYENPDTVKFDMSVDIDALSGATKIHAN